MLRREIVENVPIASSPLVRREFRGNGGVRSARCAQEEPGWNALQPDRPTDDRTTIVLKPLSGQAGPIAEQ
jgi:hypothetical protein